MPEQANEPTNPRSAAKKLARTRPLTPTTYLLRNAGKTIPLVAVLMLAVMLVGGIITMIDSIPYSIRTIYSYSKEMLGVTPRGDPTQTPVLLEEIRTKSPIPIGRIAKCRTTSTQIQSIVGRWPFYIVGLQPDDLKFYLSRQNVSGITGRLPDAGAAEVLVSRPVMKNLNLRIYDPKASKADRDKSILLSPDKDTSYSPKYVKVVGVAETDRWLILTSFDYMQANHFPPIDLGLVFAKDPARQNELDHWADKHFKGRRAAVLAYFQIERDTNTMFKTLFQILNVVIATLVIVITLMMGMLINIYLGQRLVEFGLLQAIGYTKRQLLNRVLTESILVIVGGWICGIFAAHGLLVVAKSVLMDPKAFALELFDQKAYLYTIPLPVTILIVAVLTVVLRFRKFDPVGVVERRLV